MLLGISNSESNIMMLVYLRVLTVVVFVFTQVSFFLLVFGDILALAKTPF